MMGPPGNPGIIPRALQDVFQTIEAATQRSGDVMFLLRLSYVELYNNQFRNLLANERKNNSGEEEDSPGLFNLFTHSKSVLLGKEQENF